jgi:hypothetical protein
MNSAAEMGAVAVDQVISDLYITTLCIYPTAEKTVIVFDNIIADNRMTVITTYTTIVIPIFARNDILGDCRRSLLAKNWASNCKTDQYRSAPLGTAKNYSSVKTAITIVIAINNRTCNNCRIIRFFTCYGNRLAAKVNVLSVSPRRYNYRVAITGIIDRTLDRRLIIRRHIQFTAIAATA